MAKRWRIIRVPAELAGRLDRLVTEFEQSHVLGRMQLPNAYVEQVPKYYVIERSLDELERHRARSSRRAPRHHPGD
jgi:hypothetical protein